MLSQKLDHLERELNEKLTRQQVSPRVLLDRLNLLDEASRKTSQYQDPNYFPFYYHLSKSVHPKTIFQVGFDLGLPLCCFLAGCDSAEKVIAFQKRDGSFYSPRIAVSNIKIVRRSGLSLDFHLGDFLDESLESMISVGLDLAFVTCHVKDEELNDILYLTWKHMNLDGVLVVDHMRSNPKVFDVFKSFCKTQNREYVFFETRYGTTVVRK